MPLDEADQVVSARAVRFGRFWADAEPRLRRALTAAYGPELGSEGSAAAMLWAWEHFERLDSMSNPAGYLWRVGQSSLRREVRFRQRRSMGFAEAVSSSTESYEPGLVAAMSALTIRQRTAVLLVHGHGYSLTEAAGQMGCRVRTLRNHLERGMRTLRQQMGVVDGDE